MKPLPYPKVPLIPAVPPPALLAGYHQLFPHRVSLLSEQLAPFSYVEKFDLLLVSPVSILTPHPSLGIGIPSKISSVEEWQAGEYT